MAIRLFLSGRVSYSAFVGDATHNASPTFKRSHRAFAAAFDPQPLRLDDVGAKQSIFGGLAASSWHTSAITMRLLGHADVSTTMIYTHVLKVASGVQSPLDSLQAATPGAGLALAEVAASAS